MTFAEFAPAGAGVEVIPIGFVGHGSGTTLENFSQGRFLRKARGVDFPPEKGSSPDFGRQTY